MSEAGRTASKRRDRRGPGEVLLTAVVVLGVTASLVMLLSTDARLLRVGVVCALWAAVLGAFAMMRYRRESVADRSRVRDMQTVYQLELEREVAARREYELGVEKKVRAELDVDGDELRALRAELAVLRQSIQMLYDGRLPADQVALGGEPRRELVGSRQGAVSEPEPSTRSPFAQPNDPPVTVETAVVPHGESETAADGAHHEPSRVSVDFGWPSTGVPHAEGSQADSSRADDQRPGIADPTPVQPAAASASPVGSGRMSAAQMGATTVPAPADDAASTPAAAATQPAAARTQPAAAATQPAAARTPSGPAPSTAPSPSDADAAGPRRRRRLTTAPADDEPAPPMQWVTLSEDGPSTRVLPAATTSASATAWPPVASPSTRVPEPRFPSGAPSQPPASPAAAHSAGPVAAQSAAPASSPPAGPAAAPSLDPVSSPSAGPVSSNSAGPVSSNSAGPAVSPSANSASSPSGDFALSPSVDSAMRQPDSGGWQPATPAGAQTTTDDMWQPAAPAGGQTTRASAWQPASPAGSSSTSGTDRSWFDTPGRPAEEPAPASDNEPTTGAHSTGRSVAEILAGLAVESGRGGR